MLNSITTYLRFAKSTSTLYSQNYIYTLFKLIQFRIYAKLGPHWFDLFGFKDKPISLFQEYLTREERLKLQKAASPKQYRYIEEDKIEFYKRCIKENIPTCPILLFINFEDDINSEAGIDTINDKIELEKKLSNIEEKELIVKPIGGGQGYGIEKIQIQDGYFTASSGTDLPLIELFDYLRSKPYTKKGYIVQPLLKAHPDLLDIMPGPALGTIRVNTFLDKNNNVKVAWTLIKLPGQNQIQDNWQKGTSGTLISFVNVGNGQLVAAKGKLQSSLLIGNVKYHPVTNKQLTGFSIPLWHESIDMIKYAATKFPELPALGWDLAITNNGPIIIEANWEWGADWYQVLAEKGLKKEISRFYADLIPS